MPFVTLVHIEPRQSRREVSPVSWDELASILDVAGSHNGHRLELYGPGGAAVMSVEAQGDAFHVSIQVDETRYHCLRGSGGAAGVVDLGPFAFEGTEICREREVVRAAVQAFWADGEWLPVGEWNDYACTDAVSPLNATRDKASAEVGAMFQGYQSGQRGGDAKLRVRGDWCASPATRSDIKLLGRWLQLEKLTVVDADGSTRTFSGREFLPVAAGGKPWRT